MRVLRDTAEFQKGRTAELRIAKLLMKRGRYVIPSYDYSGNDRNKAPRLMGFLESFAIPDLDVSKDGVRTWMEIKAKATADWTYKTKQYEHGIDLRLYRHYIRVEKITGTPVLLVILEENTQCILVDLFSFLGKPRFWHGDNRTEYGRDGKAYWPRAKFRGVLDYDGNRIELPLLEPPRRNKAPYR